MKYALPKSTGNWLFLWLLTCFFSIPAFAAAPATLLQQPLSNADARHLLSRTGLGISIAELDALKGLTRNEGINYIVNGFDTKPHKPMPAWTLDTAPLYWTRQDLSRENRRRFDRKRDSELADLRQWWVDTMLTTPSPQTERMVLFWHDHFATSYHSINRQSIAMARQNQLFRQYGMGSFKTLVKAMIRDPALLNYLDNLSNRKGSPNENLARELMELFTLGEGHYDENTVREAARALTGFNVSQNNNLSFEYQTWSHDTNDKTLFGKTANFDGDGLVDEIFKQPELPVFIARKFWHAFVSDYPPAEKDIKQLAETFSNSNFSITALYRATLQSGAFWSEENRASLVKSPVQLIIGFTRSTEYPMAINQQVPALLARSGMDLFAPPNVAGWTEGPAWITTGRLLSRYQSIEVLAESGFAAMQSVNTETHGMSTDNANNMGNDSTITTNMMMPDQATKPLLGMLQETLNDNLQTLKIQMAGEDYRGPVAFRVELLNSEQNQLWESGHQKLAGGHDTRKHGRVRDTSTLPWQTVEFAVEKTTAAEAQFLKVYFLNDDAGEDGDRNMYINGASLGNQWVDSSTGEQQSTCVPGSAADAGNLYCSGSLQLSLAERSIEETKNNLAAELRASSVHLQWTRWDEAQDNLDLRLTFQNLHTAHRFFPVFSFHLKSINGAEPQLELSTYSCWPDCIQLWPECSWKNHIDPSRQTLVFPLSGAAANTDYQCHFNSISESERLLVRQLLNNAPSLLRVAAATHREFSMQQKKSISRWINLFNQYNNHFNAAAFTNANPAIDIHPDWHRKRPRHHHTDTLRPGIYDLKMLDQKLTDHKYTLADLLLPGIDASVLPGANALTEKPIDKQLVTLINSPSFQLH